MAGGSLEKKRHRLVRLLQGYDGLLVAFSGGVDSFYTLLKNLDLEQEVAHKTAEIRTILDASIRAMALMVEIRDPYTAGHQQRVAQLACAIARTAIRVLKKEKMIENATEMGDHFLSGLKKIQSPHIKEVRGRGLMIGIELTPEAGPARGEGLRAGVDAQGVIHELAQAAQRVPVGGAAQRV